MAPLGLAFAKGAAAQTAAPMASAAHPAADIALTALVLRAHPVVQSVMGLLALAFFVVVTVLLFKLVEFAIVSHRLSKSLRGLAKRQPPKAMPLCPLSQIAQAAAVEIAGLPAVLGPAHRASAGERIELARAQSEAAMVQRLKSGTGILASIGAVGPFVGLFGTVFGIMNSFLAIAATKTTNLAVVAPGIAEALLATGLGLVAAIPAVLLYNYLMRRIAAFRHRLFHGSAEVLRQFSLAADAHMRAEG